MLRSCHLLLLQKYEEVTIPTPDKIPMRSSERLIPIHELDDFAKGCFPVRCTMASVME